MKPAIRPLALAVGVACAGMAQAQQQSAQPPVTQLESITVSASPFGQTTQQMTTPTDVLGGNSFIMGRQGGLGDALGGLAGVRSDTFGAGASRPVIRGQTAPRVSVVSDGSEVMDASRISPDHVVDVEPMLAERLEVLRGPATLLYGGGAIGGVVNVIDNKIPTRLPQNGIEGSVDVRGSTGDKARTGAFSLTAGAGRVAIHAEGVKRRTDDYRVPKWEEAKLDNSFDDTARGSVGVSFLGDDGFIGLAYTHTDREYGIPGHEHSDEHCETNGGNTLICHSHGGGGGGHSHDHEPVWIESESKRLDLRGEYRLPAAGIERIRVRSGWTDYKHDEFEDGNAETSFKNRGFDTRVEAEHREIAGWRGVVGVQGARSTFSTTGEEAFMPRSRTTSSGLFVLESYQLDNWRFDLGVRHDRKSVNPDGGLRKRSFNATSFSGATIVDLTPAYSVSLNLSNTHRLPETQELYANAQASGVYTDVVHMATNTIERGNPNLNKETSRNIGLTLRKHAGDLTFSTSVFHNQVKDYIYAHTLDQDHDLRLVEYRQHDAKFTGVEAEVDFKVMQSVSVGVFGDVVRGRLKAGNGDLPRIPAARAGVRTKFNWQNWTGDVEVSRVFRQNRIADFEERTGGYNMVNMGVAYNLRMGPADLSVYLRGTNLFNTLALNHASYLAHTAPLPGRRVMLGVRADF